jgi:hypothetical protein
MYELWRIPLQNPSATFLRLYPKRYEKMQPATLNVFKCYYKKKCQGDTDKRHQEDTDLNYLSFWCQNNFTVVFQFQSLKQFEVKMM